MRNDQDNLIVDLTFKFALAIVTYCETLEDNRKYVIARQLLKSGTSIGANVREAQNAESKADFIHKFKIAAKEAEETGYWLELCKESTNYTNQANLSDDLQAITKSDLKNHKLLKNIIFKSAHFQILKSNPWYSNESSN